MRRVMVLSSGLLLGGCLLDLPGGESIRAERAAAALVADSANLQMARSAYKSGHYGIAISHLERELTVRPESVAALNGLGAAYDQIGRFEVAQGYYFRALELASDPTTTLANLGYSRQLQGNPREAAMILDLALYYGPQNDVARRNLKTVMRHLASQPTGAVSTANLVSDPPAQTGGPALRVEVSNGSGVNGMANRARSLLREHSGLRAAGGDVVRLTNASHFNHTTTTVYYRSGRGAAATELIKGLPMQNLRLVESDQIAPDVDVRILLGSDYVPHDING